MAKMRCVGLSRTRKQRYVVPEYEVRVCCNPTPGIRRLRETTGTPCAANEGHCNTWDWCPYVWWVQVVGNKRCNNIKNVPSTSFALPETGRHMSEDEVLKIC